MLENEPSLSLIFSQDSPWIERILSIAQKSNHLLTAINKRSYPALRWAVNDFCTQKKLNTDSGQRILSKFFSQIDETLIKFMNKAPAGFRYELTAYQPQITIKKEMADQEFKAIKEKWLKTVATYFPEQLIEAKFSEKAIEYLKGNRPKASPTLLPPESLTANIKWSIEHIKPRHLGGDNEHNLMLMPVDDNRWTFQIFDCQLKRKQGKKPADLLLMATPMITPAQGQYVFFHAQRLLDLSQRQIKQMLEM